MLIKEYRIPLPLTVEEYRIAQLYMIAKKSREESRGAGSGVEILVNEPYENGPGGNGQYTHKIYHVGSHLPSWLKSLLPRSVLCVEEEAWNCYPYTKTRYTCPFVEKFLLEIETYYFPDRGNQENVFRLQGSELRNRTVDLIDIVNDQLHGGDYTQDEDPTLFISDKTSRGPLSDKWIDEYWTECKDQHMPRPNGMSIMCAYKLCRVEFRYWGMQTKLEKFIHDVALRKTMLRAHRQAWAWQDEWHGLTMEDIRKIERETQEELKLTMSAGDEGEEPDSTSNKKSAKNLAATLGSIEKTDQESVEQSSVHSQPRINKDRGKGNTLQPTSSKETKENDLTSTSWRMDSLVSDTSESKSENEDEYFDCDDELSSLARWSSLNDLKEDNIDFAQKFKKYSDGSFNDDDASTSIHSICNITSLILVLHAGSILDVNVDVNAKKSDITTFRGTIESVIRSHYPNMIGHVAIKLVPCPSTCSEPLSVLSSMSPYSFDVSPVVTDIPHVTHDTMPLAAVPLLSSCTPDYIDAVTKTIHAANFVYSEFVNSEEGKGFMGKVTIVGDSMGSILAYDALTRSNKMETEIFVQDLHTDVDHANLESPHLNTPKNDASEGVKLCFQVEDFFMFGSPLSLILAYRKLSRQRDKSSRLIANPGVQQVYNLFHPSDPMSSRLEPLISSKFTRIPPINVPRFQKFPLGTGQLYHLYEVIQNNSQMFGNGDSNMLGLHRKPSTMSIQSVVSGTMDSVPDYIVKSMLDLWWGNKRLDYALYCPEGLMNFPTYALPHLFHASYWESPDVVAFLLRQVGRFELGDAVKLEDQDGHDSPYLTRSREKWVRKRTSVKIKKVAANHRANDVIVKEGLPQVLAARFMYGPFDMITLTGEKVDVYVMTDVATGCWVLFNTEITDKNGRISYQIPQGKALGYGLYPVKMVVRGDQSFVEFSLAVIPPSTECIVFSIDGSFTASVSVTGRDPKVRACSVDVVRHWQDLGYLILYITGRPDIQQSQVLSWLSQHNFPLGLVSFADGLSTDPLGHKAFFLKSLIQDHEMIIHAAYGSSKDISVYTSLGLTPSQIFIVGKVSKKHHSQATILSDGYASHLTTMSSRGRARQPQGNARMLLGSKVNSSSIRNRGWGGSISKTAEDT